MAISVQKVKHVKLGNLQPDKLLFGGTLSLNMSPEVSHFLSVDGHF